MLLLGAAIFLPLAAFAGALLALGATLALAGAFGRITPTRTVLAGVAVSSLAAAVTSFVIFWVATGDAYREVLAWLLGSLAGARWEAVLIAGGAVLVIGIPLALTGRCWMPSPSATRPRRASASRCRACAGGCWPPARCSPAHWCR